MDDNKPIVLGNIKKGKTGKPLVVVIIFLFIGAILFFLPTIAEYFGDYNVVELIKNGQIIDFFANHDYYINLDKNDSIIPTTKTENEKKPILINNKTIIEFNNFTLSNFILNNKEIEFKVTTSNTIDFDNSSYYLVLYQEDKEIDKLKLKNKITNTGTMKLELKKELSNTIGITGIVKDIKSSNSSEKVTTASTTNLNTDFLTCNSNSSKIEYTFKDNNLQSIKDTFTYLENLNEDYFNIFEQYTNLTKELQKLNANSTIIEIANGFIMTTIIDLTSYTYDENTNNNYYPINSKKDTISLDMETKGFDCK